MYELKVADKKDPTWDIWDIVPQHIQHFLVTVPPSFEVSHVKVFYIFFCALLVRVDW